MKFCPSVDFLNDSCIRIDGENVSDLSENVLFLGRNSGISINHKSKTPFVAVYAPLIAISVMSKSLKICERFQILCVSVNYRIHSKQVYVYW